MEKSSSFVIEVNPIFLGIPIEEVVAYNLKMLFPGMEIKKYSLRNPSKPVVIRNEETGEVVFLRRRQNDGRLRHNKS